MTKIGRHSIPWARAGGRAVLGPVIMAGERCGWSGLALASIVVTALLSDIFDGVLARHWKCDTAGVRLFDSMADTVFYLSVAVALWLGQPRVWHDNAVLLGMLLSLEAVRFVVDFAKFGKPASYHSYLAKSWGLTMAIAVVATFAYGQPSRLLPVALLLGVAADLEGLAMSAMLPVWQRDVKTVVAALRLRQRLVRSYPHATSSSRRAIALLGTTLLLSMLISAPAHALERSEAVYIGGSANVAPETAGTLDTTSATSLIFRFKRPDRSAGEIGIDYAAIRAVQPTNEVTHHLGVAPAIAVGLLAARQRQYFVTITWTESTGLAQVVQLQVSRREQDALVSVIRARMPRTCQPAPTACAWTARIKPAH